MSLVVTKDQEILAGTLAETRPDPVLDDRLGELIARGQAARAHAFLLTRSATIAGGSSQVLRNIIAERLLGLPRD